MINAAIPAILPNFSNIKILIVGDVMVDQYLFGDIHRISPEAPVPIVNINNRLHKPGGAANVALDIQALQANVILLGLVGEDEHRRTLENLLTEKQIQHHLLPLAKQTTLKLRVLSQNQQLLRLDFESSPPQQSVLPGADHTAKLLQLCEHYLPECDAIILSDYQKGALLDPQPFIQLAKLHRCPVLIDPKSTSFEIYRDATILTPNRKEFMEAVGTYTSEEDLEKKARATLTRLNINALLLTRSEEGMTLFEPEKTTHISAYSHEVFDVTGAGDSVISTISVGIASGLPLVTSVHLANLVASLSIQKLGAAQITIEELQQYLHQNQEMQTGIVTLEQVLPQLSAARAANKKIVFTNGCFDLLHAGHIKCLRQAKKLGDLLIVGVNSDASIQRLKGKQRPILTLTHRLAMLEALSMVDWILVFEEDTPLQLIQHIQPDVLAKGGDYELNSIVGKTFVESYGGKVAIIRHPVDLSTSDIIRTIQQHYPTHEGESISNG